ncbi:hypothetical protein NDG35_004342 [Salmonella enterica]|nr:hypothetical protein [Salmonella enterica]
MLLTNGNRVIMKTSVLFLFAFFICPLSVFASTIENLLNKKGYSEWGFFSVSEAFNGRSNQSSEDEINKLFDRKKIIFNGDLLTITNACTYKYVAQLNTPLSFWGSSKTVNYYKTFLSDYKIKIPDKLLYITPVNPTEKCDFPFSEFIILDDEIVFFYENYAVFYFKTQDTLEFHNKKNIKNSSLVNEKQEKLSKICKNIERDTDNYDTSRECFYKDMSLVDTYQEYRDKLNNDDKVYLQDKIISNKNFSMKCENGCISVTYKWNGPDNLTIKQQFEGGGTEIFFSKEAQGCRVVTKSSPD